MQVKPKIEPLNLEKFIRSKAKQFDLPYKQIKEIADYAMRYFHYRRTKARWDKVSPTDRSIQMKKMSLARFNK